MPPLNAHPIICPQCEYDLRAAGKDQHGRIQCPECGVAWKPQDLIRHYGTRHDANDKASSLWSLGLLLPPIVIPFILFGLMAMGVEDGVALLAVLGAVAIYSAIHTGFTTSPRPLWLANVFIRSMALFMMIIMLSIVSSVLMCIPLIMLAF